MCRVAEGLKEKKMMRVGVQEREKQKKKMKKKSVIIIIIIMSVVGDLD